MEVLEAKQKEKEDFGWVAHPGTSGSFIVVADGFTLARGPPQGSRYRVAEKHRKQGAQERLTKPLKGSIPARTDVDRSKFEATINGRDSFAKDKLSRAVSMGEAAPAHFNRR